MMHKAVARFALGAMLLLCAAANSNAQNVDKALKDKADALFELQEYAAAYPLYSQLVSLSPQDHELNYRFGACTLYGGDDKAKAIGYLKYAVQGPSTPGLAWYFLGRAYQLDYRFDDAIAAYQHFRGTADKKLLAKFPVDALELQSRNGKFLLSNLKDIEVLSKVEVASADFFRFYDLSDIGGKIVVTPEELLTNLDHRNGGQSLTYLPSGGGAIYFSSYGKDGKTGKDIYRSELLPTGGYSTPVKLAGYINTDMDEDYAVMAPDGKSFYFCSKGHNSMGGYDVFRSNYDKGMDTFSAPENMDFAVNTPADELLYIVGPDGKQACFASDRDSKQGMVNVYRVGTTQTPVNITVFKGTFASAFDVKDRKAHIVVEDGLSREKVADVNTDINGNYLLALPRGGTYKFLVEGGPSGLAHFQNVEVPHNESPKVYRQEIQLVDQGGEQLVIKNYFDEPLPDDVMALAMDEIKRRAKLDVTGARPDEPVAQQQHAGADPLQAAGFDGTSTLPQVLDMAQKNATGLSDLAAAQSQQTNTAYALAVQNVTTAEQEAARAKDLVQRAEGKEAEQKANMLRQAAEAKQLSHEANERARAAYRTAREMDSARMGTQQRAAAADKVATAITTAERAGDKAAMTASLKELKAAMDKEKGPERTVDEVERTRVAATGAAAEADRKMKQANAQREDEALLHDRVNRVARELETAKGGKKEDLAKQHSELQGQLAAMHEEVEEAFVKARSEEAEAALAKGQAALVKYLVEHPEGAAGAVPPEAIAGLVQRVARVKAGNAALNIDPQYAPVTDLSAEEMQRRMFDWQAYEPMAAAPREATRTVDNASTEQTQDGAATAGSETGTPLEPVPNETANQATAAALNNGQQNGNIPVGSGATDVQAPNPAAASNAVAQVGDQPAQVARTSGNSATGGNNSKEANSATGTTASTGLEDEKATTDSTSADVGRDRATNEPAQDSGSSVPGGKDVQANAAGTGDRPPEIAAVPATADQQGQAGDAARDGGAESMNRAIQENQTDPKAGKDEQAFLMANKLAELEQLRQGEKNKQKRDSLEQAIDAQRKLIATFQSDGGPAAEPTRPVAGNTTAPVDYRPLEYDPSVLNEQLVEEAYPGFAMRKKAIEEGPGSATDKANMLHALEMDLVDSIDVRMARRIAVLDVQPERSDSILPELDRWRQLKATHVDQAGKALAEVDKTYAASETKAMEDAQLAASAPQTKDQPQQQKRSTSPHNDAYVAVEPEMDRIYSSTMAPRSKKDAEAVASKDQALAVAAGMQAEIDSMENVLEGLPAGKNYDKLRERTDRKIDDLLIHNVDLGQRMAFISRSEFDVAKDSAAALEKVVAKRGLPPDEPLLQMARSFQGSAESAMDQAKALRKEADRSEDALKRNSLYRQAYSVELGALRDMDRSHTVRNAMLSGKALPGESLTYEEVEARMFPAEVAAAMEPALAAAPNHPESTDGAAAQRADTVDTSMTVNEAVAQETRQDSSATSATAERPSPSGKEADTHVGAAPVMVHPAGAEVADSVLLAGFLDKFYYLSPEQRARVMAGQEERQYFLMKGSSMEKRGDADAARSDAEGSGTLAKDLKKEADGLRASAGEGAASKAAALDARADGLIHRSDSLLGTSKRLLALASVDDAQAAALLQAMPTERSASIMELEQGKRRTEPVLARVRPASSDVSPVAVTAPAPVSSPVQQTPETEPVDITEAAPGVDRTPLTVERLSSTNSAVSAEPKPFTGPLIADVFAFAPASAPRKAAIVIDAPMPEGVVYKVQVGAFRNALPLDAFSDMSPVTGEHAGNGLVRYTAGMFTTAASAAEASAKVRARGYRDAFVAAYIDGKRVPLREAMKAKAAPAPATAPVAAVSAPVPVVAAAPVQLPQAAASQTVLANYPASAEEVLAEFKPSASATDYYNDPTAAPAKQVEVVKGLFFTVQVGVYSKPTPLDKLFNISPLNSERTANAKIRYTTGIFLNEAKANVRKGATVALGVTDAFVTAYLNGKRIPVRDARALLAKFGNAVLVDPALATQ